jgi:hypothetical protein
MGGAERFEDRQGIFLELALILSPSRTQPRVKPEGLALADPAQVRNVERRRNLADSIAGNKWEFLARDE